MFRSKTAIAAALISATVAGTALTTPTQADAHPLLAIGLAAGAIGALVGVAVAHEARPVVYASDGGANCVVRRHVGWWGRVRQVEVCR